MSKKCFTYILAGAIVLGLIVSLHLAWQRHKVEVANKQVEVAVDWSQVNEMARKENIDQKKVLEKLQGTVTGVLFKESTVYDLKAKGDILIKTGGELYWELLTGTGSPRLPVQNEGAGIVRKDWNYLIFTEPDIMGRVVQHLEVKAGSREMEMVSYYLQTPHGVLPVLGTSLSLKEIVNTGVGFDGTAMDLVASMGFHVLPQIRSWKQVDEASLDLVFQEFTGVPVSAVFFNDADLPGVGLSPNQQEEALQSLAGRISGLGVPMGMVEFFPQKGLGSVARFMDKNIVRLHTIPEREMSTMSQTRAVDRFTLATTERNIRVLLVRFFPEMGLHDNKVYLNKICSSLVEEGLSLGSPQPFASLTFSSLYLLVIALAVAAGGILLLAKLGYEKLALIIGSLGFIASAVLLFTGHVNLARKGLALVAVIVFPTLSLTAFLGRDPAGVVKAIWLLVKATLFSLMGALLAVGLLADKSFMYTLDRFMGVKVAHLLPILLLLFIFWFIKDRKGQPWRKILRVLDSPVTVKYVVLLVAMAGILLVYILRTGNENAAVSAWELAIRSRLDELLAVRPRTKEFLIGHPLMLLMFYLGYRDRYLPLLLVGAIGQISLVNTFAHIHTPLIISLIRTFNGLWLGLIFGLLLIGAYWVAVKVMKRLNWHLKGKWLEDRQL